MFSDDIPIIPGEKPSENSYMRIAELSELSGVPKTTIHFYMREGLLHPPFKTSRTMAYYDQSHLDRLLSIQKVKTEMNLSFSALKDWIRQSDKSAAERSGDPGPGTRHSVISKDLKNERREKIIEAAIKIFSKKSFHYASVKDVAKAAGISTGTFYLFFPDKLQLLTSVLGKIISDLRESADTAAGKESDSVQKMAVRARLFFRFFEDYRGVLYRPKSHDPDNSQLSLQSVKIILSILLEPLIKQLEKLEKRGVIRKTDPELLAYSFTGLVIIMAFRRSFDNKYSEEQIMEFFADFLTNGIGPINLKE